MVIFSNLIVYLIYNIFKFESKLVRFFLTVNYKHKMSFTSQEKGQILAEYYQTRSVTSTQRWVRRVIQKSTPSQPTIYSWDRPFQDRGNFQYRRGNERPRIEDDVVQQVQDLFSNHPRTSTKNASEQIGISTASIHRILRRRFFLFLTNCKIASI